jgi:hypothetical protein
MKQSKSELRAALLNDQLAFAFAGGVVEELAPQKVKAKSLCRAKETRGKPVGGDMPRFSISSTFSGV